MAVIAFGLTLILIVRKGTAVWRGTVLSNMSRFNSLTEHVRVKVYEVIFDCFVLLQLTPKMSSTLAHTGAVIARSQWARIAFSLPCSVSEARKESQISQQTGSECTQGSVRAEKRREACLFD